MGRGRIVLRKSAVVPVLLSCALAFGGCSKSVDVADFELEGDLTAVVEAETLQTVTDVSCPETIDDPEAGTTFQCDVELEDGSTVTVNLELEEDDGEFSATYQGIE